MNEAELGTLVTRLTGDASGLTRTLKQAEDNVKRFAEHATQALEALGAATFLKKAFEAADRMEMTVVRLEGSISGNSHAVEEAMHSYQKFAGQLQDVTTQADETTLSMLAINAAMGKNVQESKDAVLSAMALGAAINESAEGTMHLIRMYEAGHTARLKMRLGISAEATAEELAAEMQKRMAAGMRILEKQAETTGGKLKQLGNLVNDLQISLGKVVDDAVKPVVEWLKMLTKTLIEAPDSTKRLVVYAAALAVAFLALGPAIAIAKLALAPFLALAKFLIVDLILGTAQLIVQAAWWVINAAASLAWSAALLVVNGAIWLVNAALAVMNALSGVGAVIVIALAAAIGLLTGACIALAVGALALVASAAWGAYQAFKTMIEVVSDSSSFQGPIKLIKSLFGEWYGVIKDIVRAAKVDLPLAASIAGAAWKLVVLQVKSYWPPLWEFIKSGFSGIWYIVANTFKLEFLRAVGQISASILQTYYDNPVLRKIFGVTQEEVDNVRNAINKIDAVKQQAVKNGEMMMKRAADAFNKAIAGGDNEEIKAAREALQKLRDMIPEAQRKQIEKLEPPKLKQPPPINVKVNLKFDAAMFGSQEARARIQEFQDRLEFGSIKHPVGKGGGRFDANLPIAAGADAVNKQEAKQVQLLEELRDIAKEEARKGKERLGEADLNQ